MRELSSACLCQCSLPPGNRAYPVPHSCQRPMPSASTKPFLHRQRRGVFSPVQPWSRHSHISVHQALCALGVHSARSRRSQGGHQAAACPCIAHLTGLLAQFAPRITDLGGLQGKQTLASTLVNVLRGHSSEPLEHNVLRSRTQVQQYPFSDSQLIQLPDWQLYISAMADEVLHEQSPKQLLKVQLTWPL